MGNAFRDQESGSSGVQGECRGASILVGGEDVLSDLAERLPRADAEGPDILRASRKQVEAALQIRVMGIQDQRLPEEGAKDHVVEVAGDGMESGNHGKAGES